MCRTCLGITIFPLSPVKMFGITSHFYPTCFAQSFFLFVYKMWAQGMDTFHLSRENFIWGSFWFRV